MTTRPHLVLGMTLSPASTHIAGWRHPDAVSNADLDLETAVEICELSERAALHFVFAADELCAPGEDAEILSRDPVIYRFEPLTLVAALAARTSRIGLAVTQTTTYNEPYHLARKFASIDHLSNGRLAWNLVTSYVPEEAKNFNQSEHAAATDRYARAAEFYDIVTGLWDSWDDDAFVLDKVSGRYFEPSSMHRLEHDGAQFRVRGPLNVRRSPQGHAVQILAGSSEAGLQLAARCADIAFTAQADLDACIAFRHDLRSRVTAAGRDPDQVALLAGVIPVIGETDEDAQRRYRELQELIHPEVGLARLSQLLGTDVTGWDLDAPLPDEIPETEVYKSRRQLIIDIGRREKLTLRELYQRIVGSYGHRIIVGSAETVADELQSWFEAGAVDGYIISPPYPVEGVRRFTEEVVPILQRRGVARTDYEGVTLRDNLGLPRPRVGARPGNSVGADVHAGVGR